MSLPAAPVHDFYFFYHSIFVADLAFRNMLISRMISVEVAAALMTVLLAVDAASLSSSDNSTISKSGPAQSPRRILPRNNETIDTTSSTVAPETHNVLKPSGNDPPEPSGSLSVAVYAAVLVTIVAMVYLVVRNFR